MKILAILSLILLVSCNLSLGKKKSSSPAPNQDQNPPEVVNPDGSVDEGFRFIVTADPRGGHEKFERLLQASKDLVGGGTFHVSVGDIDNTIPENRAMIDRVLGQKYVWYPVIGNHESETNEDMTWLRNEYNNGNGKRSPLKHFTKQDGPAGTTETTYSWDYRNAHFVVLNQYWNGDTKSGADRKAHGDVVDELYFWLKSNLESNTLPHVFVFAHEPAFPYHRHVGDSLDGNPKNRDRLWTLLETHRVKVFFVGHTHYYSKHRGDKNKSGNVWQIDPGNAGNDQSDGQTFVDTVVKSNKVTINIYRNKETGSFTLTESFDIN